jgi:hypothetical protein
MWSECVSACDCCNHAEQGKQQEEERKYNDKCIPEPATLWHHRGSHRRTVMPSSQSLDRCCSPDTLLEHEPLARSMFPRLFHGCTPLSISSSTDLGTDIETCRFGGCLRDAGKTPAVSLCGPRSVNGPSLSRQWEGGVGVLLGFLSPVGVGVRLGFPFVALLPGWKPGRLVARHGSS